MDHVAEVPLGLRSRISATYSSRPAQIRETPALETSVSAPRDEFVCLSLVGNVDANPLDDIGALLSVEQRGPSGGMCVICELPILYSLTTARWLFKLA